MFLGIFLFTPAGSFKFWEAWIYCTILFIPATFAIIYFLKRSPELLERRLKLKEKEKEQKVIMMISSVIFFIGFIIPGLDYRFYWSEVPTYFVIVANIFVFLGYLIVFLALKENVYASRIIEVDKEQKVISTGPYAIVRHPMYSGVILMFLSTPIALGSFWALIPFLLFPILIAFRTLNEEKVLLKGLPGYPEYYQKVRYRIIPFIW
jgi:protein-S-isoprenylcysteine O-methyltransferase Ste14